MKRKANSNSKRSKHSARVKDYRPGVPPGSLEIPIVTDSVTDLVLPAHVSLVCYGTKGVIEEQQEFSLHNCLKPAADADAVTWIHLQGLPSPDQLQLLRTTFDLHPLALEDILHQETRSKMEAFTAQQFVVFNRLYKDQAGGLSTTFVSIFLGKNYLISIDAGADNLFESVSRRIRNVGQLCEHGADYLLYVLADIIVDNGFFLLEDLGERLEILEDEVLDDPSYEVRNRIHYIKRELAQMRRVWWPQRDVIATLMRDDGHFLSATTRLYLRDCYDHCVIVIDFVDNYREMASILLDIYLSAVNQRMNDIMKALTIIATIFLPLTFLTGLYGMNFDTQSPWNMPELSWRFGYLYVLSVIALVIIGMLIYFRHKRWL